MQTRTPAMVGQRIKLIEMGDDPNPVPSGEEGEVTFVTDLRGSDGTWQVGVKWDSGRTLSLIYPIDRFEVLSTVMAGAVS